MATFRTRFQVMATLVDVLVVSQFALPPGVVVRCRPIGMLKMIDEAGEDAKLLAVPVSKLTTLYNNIKPSARSGY